MKPVGESRIDLGELKGQITKTIGAEKAKRYFYYLNRFFSQKLSKSDFDKSCYRVLGRDNLPLHNQFICSILKNARHAKPPPPSRGTGCSRSFVASGKGSSSIHDGQEPCGPIVCSQAQPLPTRSNGNVLPITLRKCRSGIHEQRLRDKSMTHGQNVEVGSSSQQSTAMENGETAPCDYKRPLQHLPVAEQPENVSDVSALLPANRKKRKVSFDASTAVHGGDRIMVENEEKDEHEKGLNIFRNPLVAPLGIPLYSARVSGAHKSLPMVSSDSVSCSDCGGLQDTYKLKKRMDQIALAQGLGGVHPDCANLLNNLLDVHLKRQIKSSVDLVKSRSAHQLRTQQSVQKPRIQPKLINGFQTACHSHMQNFGVPGEPVLEQKSRSVSLVDFRTAMELNPQQLGVNWPLLLEKICLRGFEA